MTYKRKLPSGTVDWGYYIELPGSKRGSRRRVVKTGFPTRKAAQDAEAIRRVELSSEAVEAAKPAVRTLETLLAEFFADFTGQPKTLERYRELAAYLDPELRQKPIDRITALDLHREWKRLAAEGGHDRKKQPRPLSAKTVRNICGVVSSAYSYALLYELVVTNPAKASQPPRVTRSEKTALSPAQVRLLLDSAAPWLRAFLELAAATGCRRGELLALEWTDLTAGVLAIRRSVTQTRDGLALKPTKTEKPRNVALDDTTLAALEAHRTEQAANREHFGVDYEGNLIFARPDGRRLKPDSVSASVSLLFRALKLPKPKGAALHLLRHTHGSQLLAAGVPVTEVSRRLGHASPQTTMQVYAHALPDRDQDAAKKWEQMQEKGKERRQ